MKFVSVLKSIYEYFKNYKSLNKIQPHNLITSIHTDSKSTFIMFNIFYLTTSLLYLALIDVSKAIFGTMGYCREISFLSVLLQMLSSKIN